MQIIANETPRWSIDWSNKTFITEKNVGSVIDLVVDWIEYFDFTVSCRKVILSDAPTLSIKMDYYDTIV